MSSLGKRLLDEVSSGARGVSGGAPDLVGRLVAHYGSQRKASAALGIDRKSFYRWTHGATPKPATIERLSAAVRGTLVNQGAARAIQTISLDLVQRGGSKDGQERTVTAQQLGLAAGLGQRVVDAYKATGDPDVMAKVFVAGVGTSFYRNWLAGGLDEPAPGGGSGGAAGGGSDDDDASDVADLYAGDEFYDEYDDALDYDADADPADGDYVFDAA